MKSMKPLAIGFLAIGIAVLAYGLFQPIVQSPEMTIAIQPAVAQPQMTSQPTNYVPQSAQTQYVQNEQVFDRKPEGSDIKAEQIYESDQNGEQTFEGRRRAWHSPSDSVCIPMQQVSHQTPSHICNGIDCPYAETATKLTEELCETKARHELREKQWSAFYARANQYARQNGLNGFPRRGQTGDVSSGAINNGVYGEGRPATGDYGSSRPTSYGSVKVNQDCPNCSRSFR